jgi:hypothetical protein
MPRDIVQDSRISNNRRPSLFSNFFTALAAMTSPWWAQVSWFFSMSVHRGRPEVIEDGESDAIDPHVWSGRALQVVSPSWR